jgi:hypothetical protein
VLRAQKIARVEEAWALGGLTRPGRVPKAIRNVFRVTDAPIQGVRSGCFDFFVRLGECRAESVPVAT